MARSPFAASGKPRSHPHSGRWLTDIPQGDSTILQGTKKETPSILAARGNLWWGNFFFLRQVWGTKLCIANGIRYTVEEVTAWLKQFYKGDPCDPEYRKRIIDTFVNSVYLYDDHVIVFYNVLGGKQVSYMEMLEATEDLEFDDESSGPGEGSYLSNGDMREHDVIIPWATDRSSFDDWWTFMSEIGGLAYSSETDTLLLADTDGLWVSKNSSDFERVKGSENTWERLSPYADAWILEDGSYVFNNANIYVINADMFSGLE